VGTHEGAIQRKRKVDCRCCLEGSNRGGSRRIGRPPSKLRAAKRPETPALPGGAALAAP
jgi:hypothetical protein